MPELLRQVHGGGDFRREGIPAALRKVIDNRDRNGRLNVVAECLDRLLVKPTMPEYGAFAWDCEGDEPQP